MVEISLADLVVRYGYVAVAFGTFLEGESVLLLAGFAAHRGYLDLPTVILVAMFASLFGDQLYYTLGRWQGRRLLARFPVLADPHARLARHVLRHQDALILLMRFLYGLRIVGPIAIGMLAVSWKRYLLFNLLGVAIWAPTIAGLGYLSGQVLERWLGDLERFEAWFFLAVLITAILAGPARRGLARRATSRSSR